MASIIEDVHAEFQAIIASVMERAIPAGDDIDLEVSQLDPKEYCPVAEREHYRELLHQTKAALDFVLAQFAVDKSILKPTDKIINILINEELRNHAPNEKGFTPINMRQIADRAGIGYSTALECKKRLIESLDLYEQKTVPYYHQGKDGKSTRTDSIFLKPKERQQYPRLYSAEVPISWGGNKERKPTCPQCGSDNVDVVKVTICHHCHAQTPQEIYASDGPFESLTAKQAEDPIVVESTLANRAIQTNTVEQTGVCQVGTVSIDSNILTEVGTRLSETIENTVSANTSVDQQIAALCEQHGFQVGEPCEKCSCPLHYELTPYTYCVRCEPRRGYHTYSEIIDTVYPRKAKLVTWKKRAS